MAKMAYTHTTLTVIPVVLTGQAGEVQGEQRDTGAKEETQTYKMGVISLLHGLTALGPTTQQPSSVLEGKAVLMKDSKLP